MTHFLRALMARLRGLFGDRRAELELDGEIETHLRLLTERYVRQGMTEAEAVRAARRQFGNVTLLQEAHREMRGVIFVETVIQDLRYGLWMMRRNPGFTFVAVITLALGIGANTAIFSVVNAVLLRPLPYPDPDRIVTIGNYRTNQNHVNVSGADFLDWREQAKVFEQIAALATDAVDLTGSGEPEQLTAALVSADLFQVLGIGPAYGRAFTPVEDQPGNEQAVILSHRLWQRRFGLDPQIIGQALTLGGQSRTVIGIMPPGFQLPVEFDLLLPLALDVNQKLRIGPMNIVMVIARLRPDVTLEAAMADLSVIRERQRKAFPYIFSDLEVDVIKLHEHLVGDVRLALLALFGAVTFVLLISCANVANLLMARSEARQKEMAIRAALGAGRFRLLRQLLSESLLLSVAGGAAGLLVATWGVKLLVKLNHGDIARIDESGPSSLMDGRALGFTCVMVALAGLAAGVIPALHASKTNVNETLKAQFTARAGRLGARQSLQALTIVEVALTLVLLVGAGLMIKSFFKLLAVPKGFNPDNVLTLVLSPSYAKYPPGSPQRRTYFQESLTRVQTLPGVQSASLTSFLPLAGSGGNRSFKIEGRPPFEPGKEPSAQDNLVSHDYFRTMGIEMRAGRAFTEQDGVEAPPVVIINETMARRFFPNENPIGRRFVWSPTPLTIVGVVGDTRHFGLDQDVRPEIYWPYLQTRNFVMRLVVRASSDSSSPANLSGLAAAIRNQVRAVDLNVPVNQVVTMDERLSDSVAPRRFQTLLLSVFAAVALIIATVGVYGVLSYAVGQRTHEIGIRMALGAQGADVLRLVVGQGMRMTLIGASLGLVAALALTRVMKNLLFNVSATDSATFVSITLLLVIVALLASYIPARRATKLDPLVSLRNE
jgi:putative ABC transport system permease protein